MKRRVIHLVWVSACLAIVAIAVPAAAQQKAVEQGLMASILSAYSPPACTGIFGDVACPDGFAVNWIEQLYNDGITAGCGGGDYCPDSPVTRAQMAVFIEKSMRGTANWPPHTVLVFHHQAAEIGSDVNSGTELLSMVAEIPSSGSEAPSSTNPWLIRLGPGIYDLGDSGLTVPQYVSMEGAGEEATVITSSHGMGTLVVSGTGGVRFLTTNNTNDTFAQAIWVQAGQVTLVHVTANASNGTSNGSDIALELDSAASVRASDCSFTAIGYMDVEGIRDAGVLYLDNVDISATTTYPDATFQAVGLNSWTGHGWAEIRNSHIVATATSGAASNAIAWDGGGISVTGGWIRCLSPGANALYVIDANCYLSDIEVDAPSGAAILTLGTIGGTFEVSHCKVLASYWIINASSYSALVGASQIGGSKINHGTLKCAGNYDPAGTFYPSTCP